MSTTREPELLWDAPGLQARLEALPTAGDDGRAGSLRRPVSVLAVAETGSTNSDLLAIAGSAAVDEGALRGVHVLVAEHQRAGRGRQGRTWVSEPGASLTFSLGLAMRPRHGWGALSLAVGYAVAQTLQPWTLDGRPQSPQVPPQGAGVETGCLLLKWPNDLWWYERPPRTPAERAQGAKVAGILIETQPLGAWGAAEGATAGARWVVIGIGLNVRTDAIRAGAANGVRAACTEQWWPERDAVAWWHALTPAVLEAVRSFEQHGLAPVHAEVERRELLLGHPVDLSSGPLRHGWAVGLDLDGALRVRDEHGAHHRIVAGEVSLRPSASQGAG